MMRTRPRPGISPSQSRAASSTVFHTAGAPPISVTPCSATRRRISGPSTLRSTTWVAPTPAARYGIPQPLQWNSGMVCMTTSRSQARRCRPKVTAFIQRLRWVSWTPFGRAVVPDV